MGSSKAVQKAEDLAEAVAQRQNADRKKRELETKLKSLDAQIASLNSEYETQKEELDRLISDQQLRNEALATGRSELARIRKAEKP